LVSDIPDEKYKMVNLFLQCILSHALEEDGLAIRIKKTLYIL
jgi:hypothetical protein